MKKLNNKGMTLVELVVTFAIVMILVIGMLNVIITLKTDMNDSTLDKELLEYRNTVTYVVNNDLITLKAQTVESCTFNGETTGDKGYCYTINFEDNTSKKLEISLLNKYIKYDGIKYEIPESSIMEFRDSLIYASDNANDKVSINKDENDFINIQIPFYIIDEDENYGINIVHPVNLKYDSQFDVEFFYTGNYQEYKAPTDGYYYIEAIGASGGNTTGYINGNIVLGGSGGYTSGYVYLEKGEKLYIYVGGTTTTTTGGYNGGGTAGGAYGAKGGGGATDIRYFGSVIPSQDDLAWNSTLGLNSRIMVAAGGSGADGWYDNGMIGSFGGGLIGENGRNQNLGPYTFTNSIGGTQTSGGSGAVGVVNGNSGSFGKGGSYSTSSNHGSGGGSGYYGGGSGVHNDSVVGTGAGGSSFISGYAGVNAITSSNNRNATYNTLHYSNKYFINGNMISGYNQGNGRAIISYAGKTLKRTNVKLNNVRYIQDCINGNINNTYNHWTEIQAIVNGNNVAFEKNVTTTAILASGNYPETVTDGIIEDQVLKYINGSSGNQCVTIDLGTTYNLDEIAVWHYYADGRSYNNHSLKVSSDNLSWTTLIDNESGVIETSEGKRVSAYSNLYTITNLIQNGSMENTGWDCSYSSEKSRYGNYSCKVTLSSTDLEKYYHNLSTISLNNTHKYYARVEVYTPAVNGETMSLYWPAAHGGILTMQEIYTPNKWVKYGVVFDRTSISNGNHSFRFDYDNPTSSSNTAYYDGAMLVDLTETFGSGNEPSKEWCDEHLRYFDGTIKIAASSLD